MARGARVQTDLVAKDVSLSRTLATADRNMRKFETTAQRASKALKGLFLLSGVSIAATGITRFISGQIDGADAAIKFARSLDLSVEAVSAWQFAAERSGVANKTLETGIRKLSDAFGSLAIGNVSAATDAVEALFGDDAAAKLAGAPLAEQFEKTLYYLGLVEDANIANALAGDLFGERYGQALLQLAPDLRELGRVAVEEGRVIDEAFALDAEKIKDEITNIGAEFRQFSRDLLSDGGVTSALGTVLTLVQDIAKGAAAINSITINDPGTALGTKLREFFQDTVSGLKELGRLPSPFAASGAGSDQIRLQEEVAEVVADITTELTEQERVQAEINARLANRKKLEEDAKNDARDAKLAAERQKEAEDQRNATLTNQANLARIYAQQESDALDIIRQSLPLEDQRRIALQNQIDALETINELRRIDGKSNVTGSSEAIERLEQQITEVGQHTDETLTQMEGFAQQAAANIQDAFADYLIDPFEDGLEGMVTGFIDAIRRMVANAGALQVANSLGASGLLGGILGAATGGASNVTINQNVRADGASGLIGALGAGNASMLEILAGRPA